MSRALLDRAFKFRRARAVALVVNSPAVPPCSRI
jgi:hypothetical protein